MTMASRFKHGACGYAAAFQWPQRPLSKLCSRWESCDRRPGEKKRAGGSAPAEAPACVCGRRHVVLRRGPVMWAETALQSGLLLDPLLPIR